jgi:aminopeptidase 2
VWNNSLGRQEVQDVGHLIEAPEKVSTYLVAFANGPFEYLESSYKSPLSGKVRPLRIYGKEVYWIGDADCDKSSATKDLIHQAQYGLDIKALVLPVYEKVFDIEFPLPKLDTLVVRAIFVMGPSI